MSILTYRPFSYTYTYHQHFCKLLLLIFKLGPLYHTMNGGTVQGSFSSTFFHECSNLSRINAADDAVIASTTELFLAHHSVIPEK